MEKVLTFLKPCIKDDSDYALIVNTINIELVILRLIVG